MQKENIFYYVLTGLVVIVTIVTLVILAIFKTHF